MIYDLLIFVRFDYREDKNSIFYKILTHVSIR